MVLALTRKELAHHLASFRFWTGAILAVVLAASSTGIAAQEYDLRLGSYRERVAEHEREIRAASVYSQLQPVLVRPPEPLSVLDQGFENRLGTDVAIHLFGVPVEATGGHRGNELMTFLPATGLTTVVSVVLGLLALLLTCDAIVGERTDGTLRAIFAHGVSRQAVLAGKLAGGLLALLLPLGGALAVSLGMFELEVAAQLDLDQWLRIAALAGAYVGYLSLMLLVGLLISLRVRNTSRALILSVLVWFVTVIVLPAAAGAVAGNLVATQAAKRKANEESARLTAGFERRLAAERRRETLRSSFSGHTAMSFSSGEHRAVRYRFGSAAYYDSLAAYYRFEVASGLLHARQLYRIQERYVERLRAGERLGALLAAPSPAALLERLSQSFSGTSVEAHDSFLAACRDYRLTLLDYLERKGAARSWRWFTDDPPSGLTPWPRYLGLEPGEVDEARARLLFSRLSEPATEGRVRRDREAVAADPSRLLRLDDMPRFVFHGPGVLTTLRWSATEAFSLLGLNTLAAAAVWHRFQREELG